MKKLFILPILMLFFITARGQSIFSEGFNVTSLSSIPTGWTVNSTGSSTGCVGINWNQVPSGGFVCTVNGTPSPRPTAYAGTGMGGYNSWDIAYNSVSEMITPALNFSSTGTYTLSFYVFNQNGMISNAHDSLKVYVNTSATSVGGTLLYANDPNYNTSPAGWVQYSYTIPTTYTGTTNYIIFRGWSNWGQDIFIDEVDVTHNAPTPCTGTPLSPSIISGVISPATPVCSGSTVTINAVDPNFPTTGGTTYQWESAPAATGPWTSVSTGTGANSRTYTTGTLTAGEYFRMGVTCTASSNTAYTNVYYVPIGAPQPGTISGKVNFCPGDTATYSVTNVSGTTYTWTLPASDWSGTSATNAILTTPGNTPGSISVTATDACGTSIPRTKLVIPGSVPAAPGTITGNNSICPNTTQTYATGTVTGAVYYSWSVPTGWATNGATSGTSVSTTSGTASGNVSVTAINGCGSSVPANLAVTVVNSIAKPTITGNMTPCSGALYNYTIIPVAGATSYQWILPLGWSGTTTGTSILAYAGAGGGMLRVTASSPCATSPEDTAYIVVTPSVTPAVSLNTLPALICQNTQLNFLATGVNGGTTATYTWKKNSSVVAGVGNAYTNASPVTGDLITVVLTSNAICRTRDTVSASLRIPTVTPVAVPGISINATPVVSSCSGALLSFATAIAGGGSAPGYQWYNNSTAIPSATTSSYSSSSLSNNDTISVLLTSNATCATTGSANSNKVVILLNKVVVPTVLITASTTSPGMPVTFTSTQTGGGGTPTYQWYLNGVIIPFETSASYTTSTLKAGDHIAVKMLSYDPCASPALVSSNEVVMDRTTSIAGIGNWEGSISLYPNPSNGHFTVAASSSSIHIGKRVSIDVLNMIGQTVYHSEVAPDRNSWHVDVQLSEGLANGNYTLRLRSEDGMKAMTPFMLSR